MSRRTVPDVPDIQISVEIAEGGGPRRPLPPPAPTRPSPSTEIGPHYARWYVVLYSVLMGLGAGMVAMLWALAVTGGPR